MNFQENFSLKEINTFGIDQAAQLYTSFSTVEELTALLKSKEVAQYGLKIWGGGSNILLTTPVKGVVAHNLLKGISLIEEDEEYYYIKAAAGEAWHHLVLWCVEQQYQGMENLSLIPGTVGAAPMQNIGAYGVEVKDLITYVHTIKISDANSHIFTNEACRFAYRESIFKNKVKDEYVITAVEFRLNKKPKYNTSYGAISEVLKEKGIEQLSAKAISDAVIEIRESKLPNPKVIGNAGSFFKNPEIPKKQYDALAKQFPTMPSYVVNDELVKVPAGWLIEQCQWKGFRAGDYGVHAKQALVLVNYGNANGNEVLQLSDKIIESVFTTYGIKLHREVNIW
jgi:UDP-N-acetylmuramate dehydrogenase